MVPAVMQMKSKTRKPFSPKDKWLQS